MDGDGHHVKRFKNRAFSAREKGMVLALNGVLSRVKEGTLNMHVLRTIRAREETARLCSISAHTVSVFTAEAAENDGELRDPVHPQGRPQLLDTDDGGLAIEGIRLFVRTRVKAGEIVTTRHVMSFLLTEFGYELCKTTIWNVLRRMGIRWGKGNRKNIAGESLGTVVFRVSYLQHMRLNRTEDGKLMKTICVLDESYIHSQHTTESTMFDPADNHGHTFLGGANKGRMLCILAAGFYRSMPDGSFDCGFVPDMMRVWNRETKTAPTRRQQETQASLTQGSQPWIDYKEMYHGTMDHDKFESWFRHLCEQLQSLLGDTIIVMDGASYHKRRVDPPPAMSCTKDEMIDWLEAHDVPVDTNLPKAAIYELVKDNKKKSRFVCVEMAREYGHQVQFTPPYHPELQPIEVIWGVLKNQYAHLDLAERPAFKDLPKYIEEQAALIPASAWLGAFNKARKWEDIYWRDHGDDEQHALTQVDGDRKAVESERDGVYGELFEEREEVMVQSVEMSQVLISDTQSSVWDSQA